LIGRTVEFEALRKDGSEFPVELSLVSWQTGNRRFFSGVIRDITERKQADALAQLALRKEMILKEEIHHRVKNNLQVISSLLYLQSSNVVDPATVEILLESQNRVKSIALVHEKLHTSADSEHLDFGEYANDLITDLFRSYDARQKKLAMHLSLQNILMGMDAAIPCGLIINELVSNVMKHAFPNGTAGDVWIEMCQQGERTFTLLVRDNGIGLPAGFNLEQTPSLGLRLVRDLTRQMDGEMRVESNQGTAQGTTFHFTLREPKYKQRS
jgi:two-component sensor histidine kinase